MALQALGVDVIHKFCCDNDISVNKQIQANWKPKIHYDDSLTRNNCSPETWGEGCQVFGMKKGSKIGGCRVQSHWAERFRNLGVKKGSQILLKRLGMKGAKSVLGQRFPRCMWCLRSL